VERKPISTFRHRSGKKNRICDHGLKMCDHKFKTFVLKGFAGRIIQGLRGVTRAASVLRAGGDAEMKKAARRLP